MDQTTSRLPPLVNAGSGSSGMSHGSTPTPMAIDTSYCAMNGENALGIDRGLLVKSST